MKITFSVTLFICLFSNLSFGKPIDRIVATVDNDIILLSELLLAEKEYKNKKELLPKAATYRHQVLEKLVLNKIKEKFFLENKLEISGEVVDSAIEQIAANNNLSVKELMRGLPSQGLNEEDLRKKIKSDIERNSLSRLLLPDDVPINTNLLNRQIARLPKSVVLGESPKYYNIAHILITESGILAQKIARSLRSGADFKFTAKKYSKAPTAKTGGNLGGRLIEDYPEIIARRISNMKKGQIRGPFFAAGGWHIIKVMDTAGGIVRKTFTKRELRSQARQKVIEKKIDIYLDKLLDKIKQDHYIDIKI